MRVKVDTHNFVHAASNINEVITVVNDQLVLCGVPMSRTLCRSPVDCGVHCEDRKALSPQQQTADC